jgi:hypothetical protein
MTEIKPVPCAWRGHLAEHLNTKRWLTKHRIFMLRKRLPTSSI